MIRTPSKPWLILGLILTATFSMGMGRPRLPLPSFCISGFDTVDDYLPAGATGAEAYGIASGSRGLFAVGKADLDGSNWTVRRSTNQGATWTTVDQLQSTSLAQGVAVDSRNGTVYVAGVQQLDGKNQWIVRKSTDGTSWSTVDRFTDPSGPITTEPRSVAVDGNGSVYVAGYASFHDSRDTPPRGKWIVRRSTNAGGTWATVDEISYSTGANAYSVVASPRGRVWVAGSGGLYPDLTWLVRYSPDGSSGSFRFVDEYHPGEGRLHAAYGGAIRPDGTVVFVGESTTPAGYRHWIARKSFYTEPSSWSVTDEYPKVSSGLGSAMGATFNLDGNLYVTGTANSPSGWRYITRHGNTLTSIYNTRDALLGGKLDDGDFASGRGATVDSNNTAYTAGILKKAGTSRWLVRKQQCL